MDPLTLVVGALVAGATAMLDSAVSEAAKDAYSVLKAKLVKQFGSKAPMVPGTIEQLEQDPKTWSEPLKQLLAKSGITIDDDLVKTAEALNTALGSSGGGVTMSVSQEGDNNTQQNIGQMGGGTAIGSIKKP